MTQGQPQPTSGNYTNGINGAAPVAAGSTSAANQSFVFMGYQNNDPNSLNQHMGTRDLATHPNIMTQAQAEASWFTQTQAERLAFAKKAYAYGYITDPLDQAGAQSVWNYAVGQAAGFKTNNNQNLTPLDVMDMYAGHANGDVLKARAQAGPGGMTTTKSVNLTDRLGVQAIATQVLQQALGRSPTQAEVNTYYNTIRQQEETHPSITTQKSVGGGVTETTSSGGFSDADAQQFLLSKIQNDPEFAKYQSGTTYFNAAMAANAAIGGA